MSLAGVTYRPQPNIGHPQRRVGGDITIMNTVRDTIRDMLLAGVTYRPQPNIGHPQERVGGDITIMNTVRDTIRDMLLAGVTYRPQPNIGHPQERVGGGITIMNTVRDTIRDMLLAGVTYRPQPNIGHPQRRVRGDEAAEGAGRGGQHTDGAGDAQVPDVHLAGGEPALPALAGPQVRADPHRGEGPRVQADLPGYLQHQAG